MTAVTARPSADVIVVGAGPAGLMLAIELASAGISVTVIDQLRERSQSAPGVAINAACAELLDQRGLLDTIRDECFVLPGVHFSLMFMDMSKQREPHEDAYVVPQHVVTGLIEDRAVALGAEIRRGHTLVGLDPRDDGVTAVVRGPTGDYRLEAGYLVGCDGRDSAVRSLLGIGFPGAEDLYCRGLIGEVDADLASLPMEHFGAYVSRDGGIYTAAPSGPDLMRMTTIEYGITSPPYGTAATEEEFRTSVRRVTGVELACREVRWVSWFAEATRIADRMGDGRVFIAGDAAHAFFPTNGFGLSMALGDAVNLGWKLAAVIRGNAGGRLLDTYHGERHPIATRFCTVTRAQGELLHPCDQVKPIRDVFRELLGIDEVQRFLIDLVAGLDVRYPLGENPLLGSRLPPVTLVRAQPPTGKTRTAEILRGGRGVLLRFDGSAPCADAARWADQVDIWSVEPSAEVPARAVLLRPDGYVAWLATEDGESEPLAVVLARWFGKPSN